MCIRDSVQIDSKWGRIDLTGAVMIGDVLTDYTGKLGYEPLMDPAGRSHVIKLAID